MNDRPLRSQQNANGVGRWLTSVPMAFWLFLVIQLAGILIWSLHQEARIGALEVQDQSIIRLLDIMEKRIESIDRSGTRGMQVIEDRQRTFSETLTDLRRQFEIHRNQPHPRPPP